MLTRVFQINFCILILTVAEIFSTDFKHFGLGVQSSSADDVHFYLYSNPSVVEEHEELIFQDVTSVTNSKFRPNTSVIFLSHGFHQTYLSGFPVLLKNAYLQIYSDSNPSPANIVCVDWGKLATAASPIRLLEDVESLLAYGQAVRNVPRVAGRIFEFILFLQDNQFLPKDGGRLVHLIGHSLGAHISGLVGQLYKTSTPYSIKRITGTDPARPSFEGKDPSVRLDSSDAISVDVVHTNQGKFGYLGTLGHVDFFVNGGGPHQPGCDSDPSFDCSHNMAYKYFTESILNKSIKACPQNGIEPPLPPPPCSDEEAVTFGEFISQDAAGSYGLTLTLQLPGVTTVGKKDHGSKFSWAKSILGSLFHTKNK